MRSETRLRTFPDPPVRIIRRIRAACGPSIGPHDLRRYAGSNIGAQTPPRLSLRLVRIMLPAAV